MLGRDEVANLLYGTGRQAACCACSVPGEAGVTDIAHLLPLYRSARKAGSMLNDWPLKST